MFCLGIDNEKSNVMVTKTPTTTESGSGTSASDLVIQRKRKKGSSVEKEILDLSLAKFVGGSTVATYIVEDRNLRSFCKLLNPEVSFKVIVYRIDVL